MDNTTITFEPLMEMLQGSGDAVLGALSTWIPNEVANNFWISEVQEFSLPTGSMMVGHLGLPGGTEIGIPNLDLVKLAVGEPAQNFIAVRFTLWLGEGEWKLLLDQLELSLVFSREILRAVVPEDPADDRARLRFNAGLLIDPSNNIRFTPFSVSLARCYLANSPFIVSAEKVGLDFNAASPRIFFDALTMEPPEDLFDPTVPLPKLSVRDGIIDRNGFSGEVSAEWELQYQNNRFEYLFKDAEGVNQTAEAKLNGLAGGIRRFGLRFQQNQLIASDISGGLIVPYFEEPVDIVVNIALDGAASVTLVGVDADGITLTKEELLALSLKSLTLGKDENDVAKVTVSGSLEPLLMSSNGMQWPMLEVTDLSIDSNGKFSIKEAWMDLKDLATLDLFGFHFELRRIGLGSQPASNPNDNRLWIDLSGGLRLIEQIPVGLDVEGFRLTWPQNLLEGKPEPTIDDIKDAVEKIAVEFDGINLSFGIPETVEFEGLIRFFKQPTLVGFAGDVALRVPAAGFAAEAGLMVGLSFDPVYPFLYVYFGVELPAGIPLGQSGLALKGALGMFGLNVVPDKEPDQNWYYDWYKRGPIVGAHPTNKWKPQQNALALGVGVTITTADGYVKGTRGLLVLSLPGPFLMIEGRALLLSGLNPTGEPPLRALAIFDGGAGTVQFNIEAEATLIEGLFKAYGMLEAFFDFNDLTNWHIYLGQDTPRDRRIRADLIKLEGSFLFNADAYLMIDMVGAGTLRSRMGASIGFEPEVPDIGPATVEFKATLEGDGMMTVRPEQFSGELDLSAHIKLKAFEQTLRLSADAEFLTEGPEPVTVGAEVHVKAELPGPFDPIEGTLEFQWQSEPAPTFESPLAEIDITSRFVPARVLPPRSSDDDVFTFHAEPPATWKSLAEHSPVVPLDAKPIIGFKQKMNDELGVPFARHPNGVTHHYHAGACEFTPTLKKIELYQHIRVEGEEWDGTNWGNPIASTDDPGRPLPGVWLAEFDPQSAEEPSPRRIQLWTDNPLAASARAHGGSTEQIVTAFPTLMDCVYTSPDQECVNFEDVENAVIEPGEVWEHEDLRFESKGWAKVRKEVEVISSTVLRRIIAVLVRIVAFLLRLLARALKKWFPNWRRVGQIIRGILRLELRLLKLIRKPASTTHHCLIIGGDLNIVFGRRVREAHIFLCREPKKKYYTEERPATVAANRAVRSAEDLAEARSELGRSPTLDEIRACTNPVTLDFSVADKEWILQSETGFDCVHLTQIGAFSIRKICYTTLEEYERSRRAADECDVNTRTAPESPPSLASNAYYRLDITTEVKGRVDSHLLPGGVIGGLAATAYNLFLEHLKGLGEEITERCFFRTDGPPTNLHPYVKWCYPAHQAERFFYDDDITIRFLRSNLKTMYALPDYDLKIQVTDAQGKLVPNFTTSWRDAGTATQFSEEGFWETRRRDLHWPARTPPPDNMLAATLSNGGGLSPLSRYQLQVVRTFRVPSPEAPVEKSKALFTSSFVTSGFPSFEAMVNDHVTRSVGPNTDYQDAFSLLEPALDSRTLIARARMDWEHAQVDYGLKELKGGKQALEAARLAAREANAVHDENFRGLATKLADLYFQPVAGKLEVCGVRDKKLGHLVCVWIRAPESLDVRLPVYGDIEDSEIADYVGRTEITIRSSSAQSDLDAEVVPTADGTQVLIFPEEGTWGLGTYVLRLTYHRDYADEQRSVDHRYDRPIEYRNNETEEPPYELNCAW